MKQADITFRDNTFFVSGELHFANVMSVYEKSLLQCASLPTLHFDFSNLQSSDSSGLALIFDWIKLAKNSQKPIQFSHFPADLLSIAKAAGIDGLIH